MIISQEEKGVIFLGMLVLILRTVSFTVCKMDFDYCNFIGCIYRTSQTSWLNVDPVVPMKANGGFHYGVMLPIIAPKYTTLCV